LPAEVMGAAPSPPGAGLFPLILNYIYYIFLLETFTINYIEISTLTHQI
jgi:hypothetical protein